MFYLSIVKCVLLVIPTKLHLNRQSFDKILGQTQLFVVICFMYQVFNNFGPSDWLLRLVTMNICVFYKTFLNAKSKLLLILFTYYVYLFDTNKRLIKHLLNQLINHKRTNTMFCYVIQKNKEPAGGNMKTRNHEILVVIVINKQ